MADDIIKNASLSEIIATTLPYHGNKTQTIDVKLIIYCENNSFLNGKKIEILFCDLNGNWELDTSTMDIEEKEVDLVLKGCTCK